MQGHRTLQRVWYFLLVKVYAKPLLFIKFLVTIRKATVPYLLKQNGVVRYKIIVYFWDNYFITHPNSIKHPYKPRLIVRVFDIFIENGWQTKFNWFSTQISVTVWIFNYRSLRRCTPLDWTERYIKWRQLCLGCNVNGKQILFIYMKEIN